MSFLTSLAAFIVAIAILVAIHEFGHYWVAKKLGVKVLRFSIGFGRPLWKKVAGPDQTEYVIAAIPLGGYVKMLDEREGDVPAEELDRAFNRQPVGTRIAIVAAGPLANFLFAIVAYALMYLVGVNGIKPVIGEVISDSFAAQAELLPGATIVAVNGKETPSWESAALNLINEALDTGMVEITQRTPEGNVEKRFLDLSDTGSLLSEGNVLTNIGLKPWRPTIDAVFGKLIETGSAARAGLKPGDQILRVNGEPIANWEQLVLQIRSHPGKSLSLDVLRAGTELRYTLVPDPVEDRGETIGRIGAMPEIDQAQMDAMRVTVRYGVFTAVAKGAQRTWDMSLLTVRVMWKMLTGQASLKNISGPLTIAEYAGVSALIGVAAFLSFLGIVSVSLGVLNLLPIPILDGGHLLFYFIEVLKGGPVSEATEAVGQRIGLAFLGGLMFLAFFNDISRLLS